MARQSMVPLESLRRVGPAESTQMSKDAVVYMGGEEGPFRCDHCEYFMAPTGCKIVKGFIDPAGCCNMFEKEEEEEEENGNAIERGDESESEGS